MELQFKKESFSWVETAVSRVQTQELTQELKLSDGMPDVGRVLSAWGQFVLRGKEWHSGGFSASGGIMVWVLYAPEDGTQPRCIHGWIPGQLQWDVPPDTPDGKIRIFCGNGIIIFAVETEPAFSFKLRAGIFRKRTASVDAVKPICS